METSVRSPLKAAGDGCCADQRLLEKEKNSTVTQEVGGPWVFKVTASAIICNRGSIRDPQGIRWCGEDNLILNMVILR